MLTLQAQKREIKENKDSLRMAGKLPAVFYGTKEESTPITVDLKEFQKVWREAGESSAITIDADGKKVSALIQDIQYDAVKGQPVHVDFLAIDMNKKVQVTVALEFEGVAPAVKNNVGVLVKVIHEVEVEALPKDLPHNIVVDVSMMDNIDSHILVSDLQLPNGVEMITKGSEIVCSIAEMKEEKEEVAPVDLAAIEVEKKGKKEEAPAEEEKK